MPSDTHKIIIYADKTPAEGHVQRFNATIDEMAIVIVRGQFETRDIVLHRRNDQLTKIAETHRCYDALQYPIIFWDRADYNAIDLLSYVQSNISKLIFEQKDTCDQIMQTMRIGGIDKTFLIRLILATIRSQNGIALAFASGTAATLQVEELLISL
ncbi:unnamed protein product [Onchocerca ochengi]|uniref:ATP-dependent DNA helicase n=1 Tax=Onchocerca ochengi TaxID=42157 RepID=A0A182ENP0_ONCOC|nr:unnamed protein product [Onchocerca ochengi]